MDLRYLLEAAARRGAASEVKALLEQGADPNATGHSLQSPLRLAGERGHLDVGRLLILHGADVNERYGHQANSLLHFAVETGNFGFVNILLENGADVNSRDAMRSTPLHLAAKNGHEFIVRLLLNQNADVHATDVRGQTSLQIAKRNGHAGIIRLLRKAGATEVTQGMLFADQHVAETPPHDGINR